MLEKITWIHDDFITLNEARKDGRGKSLLVEIVKFAILIILIEILLSLIFELLCDLKSQFHLCN